MMSIQSTSLRAVAFLLIGWMFAYVVSMPLAVRFGDSGTTSLLEVEVEDTKANDSIGVELQLLEAVEIADSLMAPQVAERTDHDCITISLTLHSTHLLRGPPRAV